MSDFAELLFRFVFWLTTCIILLGFFSNKSKGEGENNPNYREINDQLEKELKLKNEELVIIQERINILLTERDEAFEKVKLQEDESQEIIVKLQEENLNLQHKVDALEEKLEEINVFSYQEIYSFKKQFKEKTFDELHCLLTHYPTVKVMTKLKPNLPAKNLVTLFKPLDDLLNNWEITPIGKPWQKTSYDPELHQPDDQTIKSGDLVYIRFIGYRHGEDILYPAKVSRTLPGHDE